MEQVDIRACGVQDIAEVAGLERQWEQEQIAYGDFSPLGREEFLAALERFPTYFLVAERDGELLAYIRASLHQAAVVPALPAEGACLEIEDPRPTRSCVSTAGMASRPGTSSSSYRTTSPRELSLGLLPLVGPTLPVEPEDHGSTR